MKRIRKKIEERIYGREAKRSYLFGAFIFLVQMGYAAGIKFKNFAYSHNIFSSKKLPCRIISVGNLCLGGVGKTPMVIYIATKLHDLGYKVSILSRGYKGRAENKGGIVSDGNTTLMSEREAGDEPYMIARSTKNIPVLVGKNRFESGIAALKEFNSSVIVLDDAFQHRKLFRDIDIVLLDYNKPVGNARLLPAGSLREPVTSLLRSNCIIFTRSEKDNDGFRGDDHENLGSYIKDKPVFYASHVPYLFALINSCYKRSSGHLIPNDKNDLVFLNGRKAIAFSGIARNDDFKNTLQQLSCNLQGFTGFPDHHKYSDQDFNEIIKSAIGSGTDYIITTEKDYARIPEDLLWPIDLVVIGIKISLGEDEAAFIKFLQNRPG